MLSIDSIITWYKSKPTWSKYFLWVVLVLGMLVAASAWIFSKVVSSDTPLEAALDFIEKDKEIRLKELDDEESKIDISIKEVEDSIKDINTKVSNSMEDRDAAHETVNNASSFDDVDAAINDFSGRNTRRDK